MGRLSCGMRMGLGAATIVSTISAAIPEVVLAQCDEPVQTHHVYAPDGGSIDQFGVRAVRFGDWAVIGAPRHNANQGAAYVFRNNSGVWQCFQKFTPTVSAGPPQLGWGLAYSNSRIAVGAYAETVSGTNLAGAVYTYAFDGAMWVSAGKIANPSPGSNEFGISLAMFGDRLAIGAEGRTIAGSVRAGSVYIYEWNGAAWQQQQVIDNPLPAQEDLFGSWVAMNDLWLAVGSDGDDTYASNSGTVYMYERVGALWTYRGALPRAGAGSGDFFGQTLALHENTLIVGAPFHDVAGTDAGSAYVYTYDGIGWTEAQRLNAAPASVSDAFGVGVAFDGTNLIVGAIAGPGQSADSGNAYVFRKVSGMWTQQYVLQADDGLNGDAFGGGRRAIGLENGRVLVGSPRDDYNGHTDAGSAYFFDLDPVGLTIDDQPDNVTAGPGQTAMFSVAVSGTAPILHQWRRHGVDLADNYPFSGATTPTLTISPTFIDFGGTYDCVISNVCGSMVTTDPATLAVPYCTGDGNASRTVTFDDILAALANFGAVCP